MLYTYRDFITKKIRTTRGKFEQWTKPTGLLNVPYAVFRNPASVVLVPIYLLTKETRHQIPAPPDLPAERENKKKEGRKSTTLPKGKPPGTRVR